jgi:hypothetical protein
MTVPMRCTSTTSRKSSRAHLREALVAQDAGVVHQDVHATPFLQSASDHGGHAGFVGDGRGERNRGAPLGLDLRGHRFRRLRRDVVDHDACALARQVQRVRPAEARRPRR